MVEYLTVRREAFDEFVERRSRFIGYAAPVQTEEDALSFINRIKVKHWDATHNVYAYILREGQIRRYSDDGEPQGTAGIPTLEVLAKSEVTNTAVVVTRYFGGVLLGAGGLVRAYSHGASIALKQAEPITMRMCKLLELTCDYNQYGPISALIPQCGGTIDHTDFTETVRLDFHMSGNLIPIFDKRLADITCGSVAFFEKGEKFFEFLKEI